MTIRGLAVFGVGLQKELKAMGGMVIVRRPLAHWALLFTLVAMWGSSFLLTKIAVASLASSYVVFGRLAIAASVLALTAFVLRLRLPRQYQYWRFCAAMAVVGNCLPFWLISWGQRHIDSGLAGVLMAVMPLTTLVLAHYFVAEERLNGSRAVGFVSGFAGVVVLVGPEAVPQWSVGEGTLGAQLAVLGGAVCYGVAAILARRRPPTEPIVAATGTTIMATALMMPILAMDPPFPAAPAFASLAAVAVLGLVSTAAATVVYFKLVTIAGPSFLSLINYFIPLWAVLIGFLALREEPTWRVPVALALVLSGIALSERRPPTTG